MENVVADKINKFFSQFKHLSLKKGEILIRAEEDPSGIFYLKQGTVKEYAISRKGDELIVNIFKSISFFPMPWAINNTKNMYYFEAMTDIEVYKAPKEEVVAFIKKEPDVLYDLLSRVFKGMDGILTRMTYFMAGNAYIRLVTEIVIQTKRFGQKNSSGDLELKISEIDLAAQTGMTRETVSREMRNLKDKGFVDFNKNILTIKNFTKLEEELSNF